MDHEDNLFGLELLMKMIQERIRQNITISPESQEYECELCKDTGMISERDEEGRIIAKVCKCWPAREAKRLLRQSGLADFVDRQTFDSFVTNTPTQKLVKSTAERYLHDLLEAIKVNARKPWLYIGGNPGAGKTHICTAVCGSLLKEGVGVKYMQWLVDARRLKFMVNDDDFDEEVAEYVNAPVLYIDDLLKQKYTKHPTFSEADIKIAFTILNARYFQNKPTIISSEWDLLDDLMEADEGVFSRVYERSKGYAVLVERKEENDYRIYGDESDEEDP